MSARYLFIASLFLAWNCMSSTNSVSAQTRKPEQTDKLDRVVYSVADLVVPIPSYPEKNPRKTVDDEAQSLIQLITRGVASDTWKSNGGTGTIQYFSMGMAFVVEQRAEVHREIARLLANLRRVQDVQVSVELRLVRVSSGVAQALLQQMEKQGQWVRAHESGNLATQFVSLDDKQIFAMIESLQRDRHIVTVRSKQVGCDDR